MDRRYSTVRKILCSLPLLVVVLMVGATAADKRQHRSASSLLGEPPLAVLRRIAAQASVTEQSHHIDRLIESVRSSGEPLMEDSLLWFLYRGRARRVSIASDLSNWHPGRDTLHRVGTTDLFVLRMSLDPSTRFEYKLVVDSVWMLDPLNTRQAEGGFGPNSEICMPRYIPPAEIEPNQAVPCGRLDTILIASRYLGRSHRVYVYTPHDERRTYAPYPVLFVNDGGDYLRFAHMGTVLDNMIGTRRITPLVAVFVDPVTTDSAGNLVNMRGSDYTFSDRYLSFLTEEVRPAVLYRYRLATAPRETGIMGASLGGLVATYAVFTRHDVFGLCAAQSPAYQMDNDRIFSFLTDSLPHSVRFYLDTGTIQDAQPSTGRMKEQLAQRGYRVRYSEYPEGHNWTNWRARIDDILIGYWGIR